MKLPFSMRTVPTIFDGPATQADSHTFVIPRDAGRSPERLDAALAFISRMVNKGLAWAKGGHVPAYRPIFESDDYRKLSPQSNYADAANNLAFDPLAWYSGSGSDLENNAGTAFQPVVTGVQPPEQGLATFRDYLDLLQHDPEADLMAVAAERTLARAEPRAADAPQPRPAHRPRARCLFTGAVLRALRAVPVLAGDLGRCARRCSTTRWSAAARGPG